MVLEWELGQNVIFKDTDAQPGNLQGRACFLA